MSRGNVESATARDGADPSMGPRLMSRGNVVSCLPAKKKQTFNGAAAHEPRKQQIDDQVPREANPSMGPRLMSRGNAGAMRPQRDASPSMGPRLMSRGNSIETPRWPNASAFNGAAAHEPRKPRSRAWYHANKDLQWGRGS